MEGSTYKHRYFYFSLVDKDLQHCLISKSKPTHAIHDEVHEPHHQRHVSPWSKNSDPRANPWIQETTTPPSHLLSHPKVLDVSPTNPSSYFRAIPHRIAMFSNAKHHQVAQTPPLQHLTQHPLHSSSPHDRPSFSHSTISSCAHDVLRNVARAYALRPCQKMWSGFQPRLKSALKTNVPYTSSLYFRCNSSFLGFEVKSRTLSFSFSFSKDSYLLVGCWQEQNVTA
jgi:hypothetical protein